MMLTPEADVIAPAPQPVVGQLAATQKCGHEDCQCMVSSDEQYCSDYCSTMATDDHAAADKSAGEHGCNCGHEDCGSAA